METQKILYVGQDKEVFESIANKLETVLFTCSDTINIEEMIDTKHIKLVVIDEELISQTLIEKLRIRFPKGKVAFIAYMKTDCLENAFDILHLGVDDCLHVKDIFLQMRVLRVLSDMEFLADSIEKSQMDYLTNLYNRMSFQELANKVCSISEYENTNLCCAMIDIDHFKNVNDTYGHLVGDEVIKAISSIIKTHFRKNDLVGRFGGEEFVVLMHNITLDKANSIFEELRKKIESLHVKHDGLDLNVTVSMGLYSGYCYDLMSLQSRADELLYKAKRDGRNRVVSQ